MPSNQPRNLTAGWLLLVAGLLLVTPAIAWAANAGDLRQLLADEGSSVHALWTFTRSLMNYLIVGFLILVAFANVLRINVDTYAVKKVMPALLLAFLVGILIDIVSSLNVTAQTLVQTTVGETGGSVLSNPAVTPFGRAATEMLSALGPGGVHVGLTGSTIAAIIAGWTTLTAGVGPWMALIVGVVIWIVLLVFPVIVMTALWGMLWVRYYVLQVLIAAAPIAILASAFPFTKNLFGQWVKQLMTWAFLGPIALFLVAAGVIVMVQGFSGDTTAASIFTYLVGMGAMIAAITVPFKMGGWVMAAVGKFAKFQALSLRTGLAGSGLFLERTFGGSTKAGGRFGAAVGGVLTGLGTGLHLPEQMVAAKERRRQATLTEIQARAARLAKDTKVADALDEKLIGERRSEIKGKAAREEVDFLLASHKTGDRFGKVAVGDQVYETGDRSNFFNEINSRFEKLDKIIKNSKDAKARQEAEKERDLLYEALGGDQVGIGSDGQATGILSKELGVRSTGQARSIVTMAMAGAKFTDESGKEKGLHMVEGTDLYTGKEKARVISSEEGKGTYLASDAVSQQVLQRRSRWDKGAKDVGFMDESGTVTKDKRTGRGRVMDADEISSWAASAYADVEPQTLMRQLQLSALKRRIYNPDAVNDKGEKVGAWEEHLDPSFLYALSRGGVSDGAFKEIHRMRNESEDFLKLLWANNRKEVERAEAVMVQSIEDEIKDMVRDGRLTDTKEAKDAHFASRMKNFYLMTARFGAAGGGIDLMVRDALPATEGGIVDAATGRVKEAFRVAIEKADPEIASRIRIELPSASATP